MLRSIRSIKLILFLGVIGWLFFTLSTDLTGIAHAQESVQLKVSYLPLPEFGSDNQVTINFINYGDTGADVKITAYGADGSYLGEVPAITRLDASESEDIEVQALPDGTGLLTIESAKDIDVSVILIQGGQAYKSLIAVKELSREIKFPIITPEGIVDASIILLNPSGSVASVEISALDSGGFTLGEKTVSILSMQRLQVSLADMFANSPMGDIREITVNSDNEIVAMHFIEPTLLKVSSLLSPSVVIKTEANLTNS